VFFLVGDILDNALNLARIHGKRAEAVLPLEIGIGRTFGFHPFRRMRFQFFQQFHQSHLLGQHTQDMNVVGGAPTFITWHSRLLQMPTR